MEDLIRGKEQKQLLLEQDLHQALARLHDLEMEHARLVNTAKENGTLRLQVERGRQELEETRRLHKKGHLEYNYKSDRLTRCFFSM